MSTRTSDFTLQTSNFKHDLLCPLILVLLLSCPVSQAALRGGCSRVNITPPLGITLIGSQGKPSDTVRDDLYAKAMVLSDGHNTVAIVSADLLYTTLEEITDPVRALVHEKLGIPRQNVMVCATHTHSSPEVFASPKLPSIDRVVLSDLAQSYRAVLVRKMADSVLMAHRSLRDVKIGAAVGQVPEVLYNRRPVAKDGRVTTTFTLPPEVLATRRIEISGEGDARVLFTLPSQGAPVEFGCVDPRVFTLRMEDANGGIVGSLVGFGCHPVSIYPHFPTAISADYPAFATRAVEQAEGGVCLFLLGLAGNAVPIQRGARPCEQIGKAVGAEAARRLQFVATADDVRLGGMCRQVAFPVKKAPADKADEGAAQPITTEIQVLRLGDIYVLGLPGENLVEVGMEIRKQAGVEKLLIATVTNDAIGYVCHGLAYDEGGYEPGAATNLAKGAGEIMVNEAVALLDEIKRAN
ncbi:MAG: neutral/alkaline non-lysosomal ceramidase N-terminal domain-containing protein [Phycisphaerae bacterium]|nr:neutral/alkaline non-lysosomal ceramidase N-terminal domain-containing protein [Phycisphaerae bacterium]